MIVTVCLYDVVLYFVILPPLMRSIAVEFRGTADTVFSYLVPGLICLLITAVVLMKVWKATDLTKRTLAVVLLSSLSVGLPIMMPLIYLFVACSFFYCDL